MIIHSIIPMEVIFGENKEASAGEMKEVEYMGEKVMVTPLPDKGYVINRLISTSLKAYLNPDLQPGKIVRKSL